MVMTMRTGNGRRWFGRRRMWTVDRRPLTADRRSWTVGRGPWTADCPCVLMDTKLGCGDAALEHLFRRDVPVLDTQGTERTLQLHERQTRIDERTEDHVSGGAGEAVKIQQFHSRPASRQLNQTPSPRMTCSTTSMPMISP